MNCVNPTPPGRIDRRAVVDRHRVVFHEADVAHPLTVGNGEFAFTADVTGLQTFPEAYAARTPLCTLSQWGWHTTPPGDGVDPTTIRFKDYDTDGRPVPYLTDRDGQEAAFDWLRHNPHRLHLGRLALSLKRQDGNDAQLADLTDIVQELDLWTGMLTSCFRFEGVPVRVQTCCAGDEDVLAVRVDSSLLRKDRLAVTLSFPYGSPEMNAADWSRPDAHQTRLRPDGPQRATLDRTLDETAYRVRLGWNEPAALSQTGGHAFALTSGNDTLELSVGFVPAHVSLDVPSVSEVERSSARTWEAYWNSGAAIDFSECTDPRAGELERRVVLSQYLMRVNCAGAIPPQESGLTCNTWYGKFHLEMHWWHGVHFALWGRLPLLEKSLGWYHDIMPRAREIAERQGYAGVRWPKMVGPEGIDSPSPVAPLLLWQQPHPIYFAELCYRERPTRATLEHWGAVVELTARFMADYVTPTADGYTITPPFKAVQENNDPLTSRNPAFELTYWRFGLRVANAWRERLGQPRESTWDDIRANLAPPPQQDGRYLFHEGLHDTYTQWNWEHPAIVGLRGVLPGDGVDPVVHRATVEAVMNNWQFDRCWGWDFPMLAMAAARAERPDLAVDALFIDSVKNTYGANGHNYQRPSLPVYLPGNGGLLAAVALMAWGWEGAPNRNAPGFPKAGWIIRHEGLRPPL